MSVNRLNKDEITGRGLEEYATAQNIHSAETPFNLRDFEVLCK
jgi:hypothetical protein